MGLGGNGTTRLGGDGKGTAGWAWWGRERNDLARMGMDRQERLGRVGFGAVRHGTERQEWLGEDRLVGSGLDRQGVDWLGRNG